MIRFSVILCALCLALPCLLPAQDHDSRAKRITSQDEYKGYRVERRGGGRNYDLDSSGDGGERSRVDSGPRRGADPGGRGSRPQRGYSGGGSSGPSGSVPGWIGSLFQALAWIVVIGGAAVGLFFIVKALLGIRFKRKPKSRKTKKEKAEGETTDQEVTEAPEIDEAVFEDALASARREYDEALREGDFARATLLAYRIFWLRAGWEGCVRDEDVRTWRDALRMVRRRELRGQLRSLLPLVERVRYADYRPGREEFQNWQIKVEQVDPGERTQVTSPEEQLEPKDPVRRETFYRVLMVVLVGGIFLSYFIVQIFDTPLKADNFTNSFSTSPGGHTALIDLLKESGRTVERQTGSITLPDHSGFGGDTLVMLEPGPDYVEEYANEFEGAFQAGMERECSVVMTLPKRFYEPMDPQPADSSELVLVEDIYAREYVEFVFELTGFDEWFRLKHVEGGTIMWDDALGRTIETEVDIPMQVFDGETASQPEEVEVLAWSDGGDPVVVRHRYSQGMDTGGIILVSDPDVLTNRFIDRDGAATFAMQIFDETSDGRLLINEDVHGFSTDASLEYLAFTPPGLWVSLSVILLLGVFAWRQATVLRPREAEPQDRRARKYSIEGLARMMERARDHHTAYQRLVRRSRLVLGTRGAQVQVGGRETGVVQKGKTGKITRVDGGTHEERLVNAARRISHQVRAGETEHNEWQL